MNIKLMKQVAINVKELTYILDNMPSEQVIMLKGSHGIGKSSILTNYYSAKGMKVVTFFLGQMSDPGDLIGLPNKDEATGKTVFMPPYWFPTDDKPIVLFLDELNRARPELLQAVMDLVLNKVLAGKSLPKGSIIMAAVNDGDEYTVNELDPALVSRFNVYEFKPSFTDWISWAESSGVDKRVINFLQQDPAWLDGIPNNEGDGQCGLTKSPDRRAWKKVSDYIKTHSELSAIDRKAIAGIIGEVAMAHFVNSLSYTASVTPQAILSSFEEAYPSLLLMRHLELAALAKSVLRYISMSDLTTDQEANAISFVEYLTKNCREEVIELLCKYYNDNANELDAKAPKLADLLFKIMASKHYGSKNK